MKTPKRFLWIAVMLLSAVLHTGAQEHAQPQPAPKYRMELVYILEADSTEFIFAIGNVGFKSVASLKNFVGKLPPGSTLEWAPGCIRWGNEPLLSSEQEMEDFKAFCAEKNIDLSWCLQDEGVARNQQGFNEGLALAQLSPLLNRISVRRRTTGSYPQ